MPVSHEHRAIFVHIPKCGGSSIERALGMHGDYRVEDRHRLYGRATSEDFCAIAGSVNYLQHLDITRVRQALSLTGVVPTDVARWRTFAFVRNPFDRLVSAWAGGDPDLRACARLQGIELRGLPFARFVDATITLDHPHVTPQASFICTPDGSRLVDFVGRFERLTEDFDRVCELLELPRVGRPRLPHMHRSRHAHFRDLYDLRSRTLVMRRYRLDFEAFGYDF